MITENFFVDDKYYTELNDLVTDILEDYYVDTVSELPDDFTVTLHESELRPIIQYSADYLAQLSEDDYSENNDEQEYRIIKDALNECIDFEKLNSMIPKLYYWTRKKEILTKKDLFDYE